MPDSILRTQCLPSIKTGATGGTGAEAIAVLTEGRVTSIEMINAGRGYTSEPTITIEPPIVPPTRVSLRIVPVITITGDVRQPKTIEVAETAYKGAENNANYLTRAMQVYVKEGGTWKIRAAHWSPITGGKGTTETASNQ